MRLDRTDAHRDRCSRPLCKPGFKGNIRRIGGTRLWNIPGECEAPSAALSSGRPAPLEPHMNHDHTATFGTPSEDIGPPRFLDRWLTARLEHLLATVDVRVQLWDGQSSGTSSRLRSAR